MQSWLNIRFIVLRIEYNDLKYIFNEIYFLRVINLYVRLYLVVM